MSDKKGDTNPKDYLGPNGFENSVTGAGDAALHSYFWPAERKGQPRAVVILLHGINTNIEFDFLKYQAQGKPHLYEGSWVQELNQQDYAVCGFDFRGFGRSEGTRGYVRSLDEHVDDFTAFVRHIKRTGGDSFPDGLPYFLMAYDVGGLVGVLGSLRQPGWFAGLVLISPMLKMEQRMTELKERGSLKFFNAWLPKKSFPLAPYSQPVQWVVDAWKADPLAYDFSTIRARTAVELIKATEALAAPDGPASLCAVSVPLLVLQGGKDSVLQPGGPEALIERAATHDKRLWTVPHRWHVLQKENGNEELLSDIMDWMDDRCRTSRTKGLFRKAAAASAARAAIASDGKDVKAAAGTTGKADRPKAEAEVPLGALNLASKELPPAPPPAPLAALSSRSLQPLGGPSSRFGGSVSFHKAQEPDPESAAAEPVMKSEAAEDIAARMARIALAAAETEAYGKLTKQPSTRAAPGGGGGSGSFGVTTLSRQASARPAASLAEESEEDGQEALGPPSRAASPPAAQPGGQSPPRAASPPAAAAPAAAAAAAFPRAGSLTPARGASLGRVREEDDDGNDGAGQVLPLRGPSSALTPRVPLARGVASRKSQGDASELLAAQAQARPPSSLPPLGPNRFSTLPPIGYGGGR